MDIQQALNDDLDLRGWRVPTQVACEDGRGFPPKSFDWDEAERAVLVVLADDKMVIEPADVPSEWKLWSDFVADLFEACKGSPHRMIPIQLSENVYPLDDRLSGSQFTSW